MTNKQSGFTLLELMIVVAIISLISSFAIPNLRASLTGSREAAAIGSIRTISTAVEQYRIRRGDYPEDLTELAVQNPALIDSELATGERNGYLFELESFPGGFSCNADPASAVDSRYFYVDETGVIRQSSGEIAGPESLPIQ